VQGPSEPRGSSVRASANLLQGDIGEKLPGGCHARQLEDDDVLHRAIVIARQNQLSSRAPGGEGLLDEHVEAGR